MIFSCTSEPSISNVSVSLDSLNVLRANISYQIPEGTSSFVEYWIKSDTVKKSISRTLSKDENKTTLICLLPETEYSLRIVAQDNHAKVSESSTEYDFTTGALPDNLPKLSLAKNTPDAFDGFILVRRVLAPGCALMINNQGQIVWYECTDTTLMNPYSWTQNNTIISLDHPKRINEFDLYGNKVFGLEMGQKGFDRPLHHEIIKNESGNILALTKENRAFDLSKVGGHKQDTVHGDGILVLDPQGNKLWSWDIFQVADPLEDPEIMRWKDDWSHANSLNILDDGNYIISLHHFDEVWKINSTTGELMWKLGRSDDFDLDKSDRFYKQHAAHQTPNGNILLFDNGDDKRTTSRALQLELDETNMKAKAHLSVFLPDSLFSFKQGSSYYINSEKILFCIATKNKVAVTNLQGEVLWQINSNCSFYRAVYIPGLLQEDDPLTLN